MEETNNTTPESTVEIETGAEEEAYVKEGPYIPSRTRGERKRGPFGRLWVWFTARPKWLQVTIAVPTIVLSLAFALTAIELLASVGRVHPGVEVAGVPVGGMTSSKAEETLDSELGERMEEPVTLTFESQKWLISKEDVDAELDSASAIDMAMDVGRSGDLGDRVKERFGAWFDPVELDAVVIGDPAKLTEVLASVETSVGREPQDATIVIEATSAHVESATVGLGVRAAVFKEELLKAFTADVRGVPIPVEFLPVSVTDEGAEEALWDAEMMMSAPVEVTYEDKSWSFTPEDIAGWIDFRPVPAEEATVVVASSAESVEGTYGSSEEESAVPGPQQMKLEAFISTNATSETVTSRVGEAGKSPKDASFSVSNGRVQIVPHQDGVGPDIEALALSLSRELLKSDARTVELRTMRVEPEITTAKAEGMGITERLSTYSTTYSSSNKPRVNNIHTLADALDGTLLAPGEKFSFNERVGPRTAAKGYQEAGAIVNGELVPQLGGGICQVGTTIFNTVYESGLAVLERNNHSFYIDHYPKGRDATVSWGGPDFKFENDTDNWILIATGYSNSSVTLSIYGTDPGYEVTTEMGSWRNIKPHPVKEIEDDTMPVGSKVVEDGGVDGKSITVTRVVKKNGKVIRTDTFNSVYRPKLETLRVGTMEPSEPETSTAE